MRITPAPAGKTNRLRCLVIPSWDHPRTCGENETARALERLSLGSPPHLRGKHKFYHYMGGRARITPAPAGKTASEIKTCTCGKDHPRTCGENEKSPVTSKTITGSPPHLRGKPDKKTLASNNSRITPAPAGKTHQKQSHYLVFGDHPRTCGENMPCSFASNTTSGSPPHLRGKHIKNNHII